MTAQRTMTFGVAVSYTHLDVYKRQGHQTIQVAQISGDEEDGWIGPTVLASSQA